MKTGMPIHEIKVKLESGAKIEEDGSIIDEVIKDINSNISADNPQIESVIEEKDEVNETPEKTFDFKETIVEKEKTGTYNINLILTISAIAVIIILLVIVLINSNRAKKAIKRNENGQENNNVENENSNEEDKSV